MNNRLFFALLVAASLSLASADDSTFQSDHPELFMATLKGDAVKVRNLLNDGEPVNAIGEKGVSPLHLAAGLGHTEVILALLERNADIHKGDEQGGTPLMWASNQGSADIVRALIASGAKLDAVDDDGTSALILASGHGHLEVMRLLIENDAPLDVINKDGETALMSAANNGHGDAIRLVLEAMRQTGVEQEGTLTTANKMGSTALLLAAAAGHADAVSALLEAGVDTIKEQVDTYGASALHRAARCRQPATCEKVVQTLLKAGVNPSMVDGNGLSATEFAAATLQEACTGKEDTNECKHATRVMDVLTAASPLQRQVVEEEKDEL